MVTLGVRFRHEEEIEDETTVEAPEPVDVAMDASNVMNHGRIKRDESWPQRDTHLVLLGAFPRSSLLLV